MESRAILFYSFHLKFIYMTTKNTLKMSPVLQARELANVLQAIQDRINGNTESNALTGYLLTNDTEQDVSSMVDAALTAYSYWNQP